MFAKMIRWLSGQMKRGNRGQCVLPFLYRARGCLHMVESSTLLYIQSSENSKTLSFPRISHEIGETSVPATKLQPGRAIAIIGTPSAPEALFPSIITCSQLIQ